MFIRIKRSVQGGRTYEYLQLVRSYRHAGKPRQQVLATLGRKDQLVASGELDKLVRNLARFSEQVRVVEAVRSNGLRARTARCWGPALVFERLWQRQRIPELLGELGAGRGFQFDLERVSFAMALQRLCAPGSDLQGSHWVKGVEAGGFAALELHHFYRTCRFLYEVRERLESELFERERDLFSDALELLFVDTTSLYVYRDTETVWRKRGYSRDRRPELPQLVLCVAVERHGWPVAWEVFPGNTADVKALHAVVARLRERFRIRRVTVVADRGMIGKGTIERLAEDPQCPYDYILGCRMRAQKEVNEEVLGRAGRFRAVAPNLEVKEVFVGKRRYIVCRNPEEAAKDGAARAALLEKLEHTLEHKGPKSIVGNRGYARFVKISKGAVRIDREAIRAEERLDGKFVLRTSTELPAEEVALAYKSLWRVERTFREEKSTLEVRPIFHHSDTNSIGHIVACFLALRLEVDLQRRLEERGSRVSWPVLMRELAQVQAVDVELDGQRYRLRTDLPPHAYEAFAAAGVRPPASVTHCGPAPPPVEEPEPPTQEALGL